MSNKIKETVSKEDTFDKLEIRLGRVINVEELNSTPKKSYKMNIDFGKFGKRTSIGRFTNHSIDEIKGKLVLGVLNFESRSIGDETSDVLVLGVQFPKAESGEATFVTSAAEAKIGGKLF